MSKKTSVQIPAQVVDDALRAVLAISSLLHAATYHNHDIELIKKSLRKMGGLKTFDKKTGALFEYLPKDLQARLMER